MDWNVGARCRGLSCRIPRVRKVQGPSCYPITQSSNGHIFARLLLLVRGFWLHSLGTKSCRRWWKDPKLAQDPCDSIGRLGSNANPILQSVGFESYFFDSLSAGNGIVGTENLKEFSVSRRLGIGRHESIKGRVRAPESLKSQSNDHAIVIRCQRWL